jgi:hypothetical protein
MVQSDSGDGLALELLEPGTHNLPCLGRSKHRHDLEINDIAPVRDPFVEKGAVVAFHDLVAERQVLCYPAPDVLQSFRRHASAIAKTAIHREGIAVAEPFDDHVMHGADRRLESG